MFLTPDGDLVFAGQFANSGSGAVGNFHGTLLGNTLDGKIDMALGTIEGRLSPDGSKMSGALKLARYTCTWSASLQ